MKAGLTQTQVAALQLTARYPGDILDPLPQKIHSVAHD